MEIFQSFSFRLLIELSRTKRILLFEYRFQAFHFEAFLLESFFVVLVPVTIYCTFISFFVSQVYFNGLEIWTCLSKAKGKERINKTEEYSYVLIYLFM